MLNLLMPSASILRTAMDDIAAESSALSEAIVFLDHFQDLPAPRQQGKVLYPLNEVLLLSLIAVLAGAETFADIARFGETKLSLLRRFLPFRDGTPAHDHLGDIFAVLDAETFQRCFVSWVAALTGAPADVIAIDGKTSRRSCQKKGAKEAIHPRLREDKHGFCLRHPPASCPGANQGGNRTRLSPFPNSST